MSEMLGKRSGWLTFAGIVLIVAGVYNGLSGLGALSDDDTIAAQAQEVLFGIDLTAWGWLLLIVGVLQILAGVLIFQRNPWGLWLGVIFACLSAFLAVFMIFPFPIWAFTIITIDILVLYALLTRSEEFEEVT
jgi:uncharacterized membrane protein HdeD (DUF308 family)